MSTLDAAVPDPPWRRAARPARQPLTRDAIVQAALRVMDREGVESLSMRKVAQELGTGAGSLYWHINDKSELLDLVFDHAVGEIAVPDPDPDRWTDQLKAVAHEELQVMRRHPGLARLALGRWPIGPHALVFAERLLAILRAGGVPDRVAAFTLQLLPSYVGWFAMEEDAGGRSQPPHAGEEDPDDTDRVAQVRDYLASLPPASFPNLLELLDDMTGGDEDERFAFGLDVLVRGLAARSGR